MSIPTPPELAKELKPYIKSVELTVSLKFLAAEESWTSTAFSAVSRINEELVLYGSRGRRLKLLMQMVLATKEE